MQHVISLVNVLNLNFFLDLARFAYFLISIFAVRDSGSVAETNVQTAHHCPTNYVCALWLVSEDTCLCLVKLFI